MPVGSKAHKHPPRKQKKRPPGSRVKDPVPVAPLRDKILELLTEGETYADICKRVGWVDKSGRADTSRLQRRLGLRRESPNRKTLKDGSEALYGGGAPHECISYARAVELCRGLGCDPVDIRHPETGEPLL